MTREQIRFLAMTIACLCLQSQTAFAGSVTGLSESGQVISCDVRRSNADTSWCTTSAADQIFSGCYVVIRSPADPVSTSCDWQSCGPIAFVGAKPKVDGSSVVEYGMSTNHVLATNPPADWMLNQSTKEVLPKFPFPRNYLTIGEFVSRRDKCLTGQSSSDDIQKTICPVDKQLFESNSYFACLKQKRPAKVGRNL
jgi:hypothetical protein